MNEIITYIKPELLILVPVLYFIGMGLKKSILVDKLIPIAIGIIGVFLALLYTLATNDIPNSQSCLLAVFVGITQGVLCAGGSVYFNQIGKQLGK